MYLIIYKIKKHYCATTGAFIQSELRVQVVNIAAETIHGETRECIFNHPYLTELTLFGIILIKRAFITCQPKPLLL